MELLKVTTPAKWRAETLGHSYDVDNFPSYNKFQCFDYFAYFCKCEHMAVSLYCGLTGYVSDLWRQRDQDNFGKYFDYISALGPFQNGDWLFWGNGHPHVAMYYDGKELGQNQGAPYVNEIRLNHYNILGAFRLKRWNKKGVAHYFDKKEAGTYITTEALNCRTGPGTDYPIITTFPKNTQINCHGYYDYSKDIKWLYIESNGVTGFVTSLYIKRKEEKSKTT